jgi:hypothetical protein
MCKGKDMALPVSAVGFPRAPWKLLYIRALDGIRHGSEGIEQAILLFSDLVIQHHVFGESWTGVEPT